MRNMRRMLAASTNNMEEPKPIPSSSKLESVPKPHVWKGVKAGLLEAKEAIENKNLDTAEALLREVIEFAPAETETWHILAAVLNRKGKIEEAKACLKRVLKHKEASISLKAELPASKRMAKILWAQGDHDSALNMLAELILASPDDELIQLQQKWTTEHE